MKRGIDIIRAMLPRKEPTQLEVFEALNKNPPLPRKERYVAIALDWRGIYGSCEPVEGEKDE